MIRWQTYVTVSTNLHYMKWVLVAVYYALPTKKHFVLVSVDKQGLKRRPQPNKTNDGLLSLFGFVFSKSQLSLSEFPFVPATSSDFGSLASSSLNLNPIKSKVFCPFYLLYFNYGFKTLFFPFLSCWKKNGYHFSVLILALRNLGGLGVKKRAFQVSSVAYSS